MYLFFKYFKECLIPSVRSVDFIVFLLLTEAAVRRGQRSCLCDGFIEETISCQQATVINRTGSLIDGRGCDVIARRPLEARH